MDDLDMGFDNLLNDDGGGAPALQDEGGPEG